jgi:hypothetical protein
MALVTRVGGQCVRSNSGTRKVVDLFQTLASLSDNMRGQCIRDGHSHEVAVGFSLLREGLSKVEGEVGKGSGLRGRTGLYRN